MLCEELLGMSILQVIIGYFISTCIQIKIIWNICERPLIAKRLGYKFWYLNWYKSTSRFKGRKMDSFEYPHEGCLLFSSSQHGLDTHHTIWHKGAFMREMMVLYPIMDFVDQLLSGSWRDQEKTKVEVHEYYNEAYWGEGDIGVCWRI